MKRSERAQVAKETVKILEEGSYLGPRGRVSIEKELQTAVEDSVLYGPEGNAYPTPSSSPSAASSEMEVVREGSLVAARRLVEEEGHSKTLCLNFASAKNPGGGFLGGAQAQEEALARSSGLYATQLKQWAYYEINRAERSILYTEHMIYSPGVPVFREEEGALLQEPYPVSFLTAPAVNAGLVRKRAPERVTEIEEVMRRRVARVLGISSHHGYTALVLGAWGCGVFQNDPALIARLFKEALDGEFKNHFAKIIFAVLDSTKERSVLRAFQEQF